MNTSKRSSKSNRKPKVAKKVSRTTRPKPGHSVEALLLRSDCPYRPGTLYAALFIEAQDYIAKRELITKVADLTGKSEKVVNFAFQVLKSPKHRSNKNRSAELTEGDKVKLIAVRK